MAQPFLEENPLTLELRTLRGSVARFQEEAHATGVKLQRHALESAKLHERAVNLERENDLLKAEVAVLRANPHPDANNSDARSQVQEMTLALRRLSQKIESTEDALLSKTTELIHAQAETIKAKAAAEAAYELGARVRGREEAALARERELQNRIVQLEEDGRIADVALVEYAALVRGMQNGKSLGAAKSSGDAGDVNVDEGTRMSATIIEGKLTRSNLIAQFQAETDKLHREAERITGELQLVKSLLTAETKTSVALIQELGNTKAALDKLHLEDNTAAKMVSRYMKFSQTSTDDLLSKLSALKARHEGTLRTLSLQNHALSAQLRSSETHANHLLRTLDELGGEIMKETWGRRREVGMRIRMSGREDRIVEAIRRWTRKGEELIQRIGSGSTAESDSSMDALLVMAQDARILLSSLDEGAFDEELGMSLSGGRARTLLANVNIDGLLNELKGETEKRLALQRQLAAFKVGTESDASVSLSDVAMDKEPVEHAISQTIEGEEEDVPPIVPEKTDVFPAIPIAPSLPNELQAQIPLNGQASNDSEISRLESNTINIDIHVSDKPRTTDLSSLTLSMDQALNVPVPFSEPTASLPSPDTKPLPELIAVPSVDSVTSTSMVQDGPAPPSDIDDLEIDVDISHSKSIYHMEAETSAPPTQRSLNEDDPATAKNTNENDLFEHIVPMPRNINTTEFNANISSTPATHEKIAPTTSVVETVDDDTGASVSFAAEEKIVELPAISDITVHPSSPPAVLTSQPSELITPSPFASSSTRSIIPPSRPQTHPLLDELVHVTKRYDDLQRAFRDCHHALETLKAGLKDISAPPPLPHISNHATIPKDILNAALGRLDDYTEDARVELEIQVGDEALLAKGYEALLSVPGALASAALSSLDEGLEGDKQEPTQTEVEKQISDFVSGTDPTVRRAREKFSRKLDDVQHDIAALKRAIHDPDSFGLASSSLGDTLLSSPSSSTLVSPSASSSDLPGHTNANGGWTSWIRNASRPASPAPPPHGPAPTFGNIMTAPRLRHTPSSGNMSAHSTPPTQSPARSRRPSFFGLGGGASEPPASPLAALELRVPMPSFAAASTGAPPPTSAGAFAGGYGGILSPTSPLKSGGIGMGMAPPARARTVSSTMYMLGLGAAGPAGAGPGVRMARAASTSSGLAVPASPLRSTLPRTVVDKPSISSEGGGAALSANKLAEAETESEEEDTDVE